MARRTPDQVTPVLGTQVAHRHAYGAARYVWCGTPLGHASGPVGGPVPAPGPQVPGTARGPVACPLGHQNGHAYRAAPGPTYPAAPSGRRLIASLTGPTFRVETAGSHLLARTFESYLASIAESPKMPYYGLSGSTEPQTSHLGRWIPMSRLVRTLTRHRVLSCRCDPFALCASCKTDNKSLKS